MYQYLKAKCRKLHIWNVLKRNVGKFLYFKCLVSNVCICFRSQATFHSWPDTARTTGPCRSAPSTARGTRSESSRPASHFSPAGIYNLNCFFKSFKRKKLLPVALLCWLKRFNIPSGLTSFWQWSNDIRIKYFLKRRI